MFQSCQEIFRIKRCRLCFYFYWNSLSRFIVYYFSICWLFWITTLQIMLVNKIFFDQFVSRWHFIVFESCVALPLRVLSVSAKLFLSTVWLETYHDIPCGNLGFFFFYLLLLVSSDAGENLYRAICPLAL